MNQIIYVTGSEYKFNVAKDGVSEYKIELLRENLETPEIQSETVEEVASFSATWAANKLNKPVVVTDVGYYITALNGFPGVFIKYVNKWFSAQDYLKLMEGKTDRSLVIKIALAFCNPGDTPKLYTVEQLGDIALVPGQKGDTPINEIFIPKSLNKVESEIEKTTLIKYWNQAGLWSGWCNSMGFDKK